MNVMLQMPSRVKKIVWEQNKLWIKIHERKFKYNTHHARIR